MGDGSLEYPVSQELVLRNVHGCADDSLKLAIVNVQSDAQVFQPAFVEVIEVPIGPGCVNECGNRVDSKLNIQRVGLLSC